MAPSARQFEEAIECAPSIATGYARAIYQSGGPTTRRSARLGDWTRAAPRYQSVWQCKRDRPLRNPQDKLLHVWIVSISGCSAN
jgi:hypothetical protein